LGDEKNPGHIQDLRRDYGKKDFDLSDLDPNPVQQFSVWFDQAREADIYEPNAMTLCSVGADGRPSSRVVLLKDLTAEGFVFYTNYDSRKAQDLQSTGVAALNFLWDRMHRQVRVEGTVERVAEEVSDAYFNSRPLGSRLGAMASPQSQEIDSRQILEERMIELEARYEKDAPQRPSNWGGYCVKPTMVEFWQGRSSRLHDRFAYFQEGGSWAIRRLAP